MSKTIFAKIIDGELPAEKIYEDEYCIAIHDISPQAPVHVLLIPKKGITKLSDAKPEDQELLGHLMLTAGRVAESLGLHNGFRLVVNNGEGGGQTVFHLHLHIMGGHAMTEAGL